MECLTLKVGFLTQFYPESAFYFAAIPSFGWKT